MEVKVFSPNPHGPSDGSVFKKKAATEEKNLSALPSDPK
jgi:hypothetical protein